jgi:hypothetical protein
MGNSQEFVRRRRRRKRFTPAMCGVGSFSLGDWNRLGLANMIGPVTEGIITI